LVEFGPGQRVMAMYPNTSAFYLAEVGLRAHDASERSRGFRSVVQVSQSGIQHDDDRCTLVLFDDDEDETNTTPPRLIPNRFITIRE
jgi:hypothetical protein